ncbi:hypothetical protein EVAR_811_1 [Eumeta japonica]|uniref:Uncharacterized protein n=1 Tax=Eumeta variegata TaxID=151549 RepID=A0A4C1SC93_EUMVA|nr:hypothetical protein EVAR_811_1 [Eumeta japonica]
MRPPVCSAGRPATLLLLYVFMLGLDATSRGESSLQLDCVVIKRCTKCSTCLPDIENFPCSDEKKKYTLPTGVTQGISARDITLAFGSGDINLWVGMPHLFP